MNEMEVDDMDDLVVAFQRLNLDEVALEEAPTDQDDQDDQYDQDDQDDQDASEFELEDLGVSVGGAGFEVFGLRGSDHCTDLAQAADDLLRGLQALLEDLHAGGEEGKAGAWTEVMDWASVSRTTVWGVQGSWTCWTSRRSMSSYGMLYWSRDHDNDNDDDDPFLIILTPKK